MFRGLRKDEMRVFPSHFIPPFRTSRGNMSTRFLPGLSSPNGCLTVSISTVRDVGGRVMNKMPRQRMHVDPSPLLVFDP